MDIFTLANTGSISAVRSAVENNVNLQALWNEWAKHRIETLMEEVKALQAEVEKLKMADKNEK